VNAFRTLLVPLVIFVSSACSSGGTDTSPSGGSPEAQPAAPGATTPDAATPTASATPSPTAPAATPTPPAATPSATTPAATPPTAALASGNPFADARFYLNPDYAAEVQTSIVQSPANAAQLEKMKGFSTAIWLDSIAKVASVGRTLDDAAQQQTASGKPVVTVFVIYDLPNRDCAANSSNGELTVDGGGLATYQTRFIDAIQAQFAAHPNQRIVGIVEPDSLPNLATNMSIPKCAASETAYRSGVAYAINKLAAPNVSLYLDAAHAGWLGWPDNMTKISTIFQQVLTAAGGADKIRGFATNTANYTVLHETPQRFDYQFNPCHDELTYVQKLAATLAGVGISNKGFIIDTSRNGLGGIRAQWGSWCNVKGAGLGERPVANPGAGIDSYYWVKPPGESDGSSDASGPRYDSSCSNPDATLGAPQAGTWFHAYFLSLVQNANPPL
jgi:cellulose 1,4-beta-cellobiosidase